jgi:hypothetical protein
MANLPVVKRDLQVPAPTRVFILFGRQNALDSCSYTYISTTRELEQPRTYPATDLLEGYLRVSLLIGTFNFIMLFQFSFREGYFTVQ